MEANATLSSSLIPVRGTEHSSLKTGRSAHAVRSIYTPFDRFHWLLESVSRQCLPVALSELVLSDGTAWTAAAPSVSLTFGTEDSSLVSSLGNGVQRARLTIDPSLIQL